MHETRLGVNSRVRVKLSSHRINLVADFALFLIRSFSNCYFVFSSVLLLFALSFTTTIRGVRDCLFLLPMPFFYLCLAHRIHSYCTYFLSISHIAHITIKGTCPVAQLMKTRVFETQFFTSVLFLPRLLLLFKLHLLLLL